MRVQVKFFVLMVVIGFGSCTKELVACFTYTPSTHPDKDLVHFSNCSENAEEYLWDFEGLKQSKSEEITFEFPGPGDYLVTLRAMNKRKSDEVVQTVHVSAPLWIVPKTESAGTHYRKYMKFDLEAYAKAGLGVLGMMQVRDGRIIGEWDSVVVDSPMKQGFTGSFRFKPKWSIKPTVFHFMVMDRNGANVTDSLVMPTLNGGDSTQGRVKSVFYQEAIAFDTSFAFSRGTYVESSRKIYLYLISKSKDYIYIHDFMANEGELKTYSCQIYTKHDGFVYKNMDGKSKTGNRLVIDKLDLDEMVISGHLETPVLQNNWSIDKLTVDFENVRITKAVKN
ncbi:MAG: PKD domain-containing protein [Bacteroidetes bacterium]|nr:PKD domain-containing protein [Bacteroidota bacterium]